MKLSWLTSTILTIFAPTAFAGLTAIDPAMKYQPPANQVTVSFDKVDQNMDQRGYAHLALDGSRSIPGHLDWFDRIYTFKNLKKTVFIKSNLMVDNKYLNQLFSHHDGILTHFTAAGTTFAAFFTGFASESEATEILKLLQQSLPNSKTASTGMNLNIGIPKWLRQELSSQAWAEEANNQACVDENGINIKNPQPSATQDAGFVSAMLKHGGNCISSIGKGFIDATYGAAVSAVGAVQNAAAKLDGLTWTDISPTKLWSGAVAQWNSFKNFMSGLGEMLANAIPNFWELPADQKVQIGCELVGSVGTGVIIAAITGGGATPLIMRGIALALEKVAAVSKSAALLAKAKKLRILADSKNIKLQKHKKLDDLEASYRSQIDRQYAIARNADGDYRFYGSRTSGPRSQSDLEFIGKFSDQRDAAFREVEKLKGQWRGEIKAVTDAATAEERNSLLNYAARASYLGLAACGAVRGVTAPPDAHGTQ